MPQPTVSAAALEGHRVRDLAWRYRVASVIRPTRRLSTDELQLADDVATELDFDSLLPRAIPRGYRLTAVSLVPHCRTLVTFRFRGPRSRRFQLTEQLALVSFEAQFAPGRLPSAQVRLGGRVFTVALGAFDGTEPIDGLYWHDMRRVISWDQGKTICQLELRGGESPSVWEGLRIAASVTPMTTLAARERRRA